MTSVDEIDLTLVHALQIAPRAPWAELAEVVGIDPGLAARRWRRLHTSGLAWATVGPGDAHVRQNLVGGAIEVHCRPAAVDTVAAQVSQVPWVLSVAQVTSRCELLLEAAGLGLDHLVEVTGQVGALDQVERVRLDVATTVHVEGSTWELDALSPHQRQRLRRLNPQPGGRGRPSGDVTLAIASVLRDDVRATAADIARRLDWSESTARRRLDQVLASQALRLRIDLAQPATGFPLTVTTWFRVASSALARAAAAVGELRSTRMAIAMTGGPANLLVTSWLRSPGDVEALDADLDAALRGAVFVDRTLTTRTFKRGARMLAPDGTARALVPVTL